MTRVFRSRADFAAPCVGVVLAATAVLEPCAAQPRERLLVDVGECVELTAPEQRLACFEAQVERSRTEGAPPGAIEPAATLESPGPAAARETEHAVAGVPAAAAAPVAAVPEQRRDDEPAAPVFVARVTALREALPNSYVITLDNGQVWRQVQPLRFALRVGAEVRVFPPPWGDTFRLSVEGQRGFIQVARVR